MKTIKEKIAIVKEVLKVEANELTTLKRELKETQRCGKYAGNLQCDLSGKRYRWRHKFIAYCILKGREIDEIEKRCHEDNQPNLQLVEQYKRDIVGDDNA